MLLRGVYLTASTFISQTLYNEIQDAQETESLHFVLKRDAAQVGQIRIKITHGQLNPLTICSVFIHREALMCLFWLVHD